MSCSVCLNAPLSAICMTCPKNLCRECTRQHDTYTHDCVVYRPDQEECLAHSQPFTTVCKEHRVLLCPLCTIEGPHADHAKEDVPNVVLLKAYLHKLVDCEKNDRRLQEAIGAQKSVADEAAIVEFFDAEIRSLSEAKAAVLTAFGAWKQEADKLVGARQDALLSLRKKRDDDNDAACELLCLEAHKFVQADYKALIKNLAEQLEVKDEPIDTSFSVFHDAERGYMLQTDLLVPFRITLNPCFARPGQLDLRAECFDEAGRQCPAVFHAAPYVTFWAQNMQTGRLYSSSTSTIEIPPPYVARYECWADPTFGCVSARFPALTHLGIEVLKKEALPSATISRNFLIEPQENGTWLYRNIVDDKECYVVRDQVVGILHGPKKTLVTFNSASKELLLGEKHMCYLGQNIITSLDLVPNGAIFAYYTHGRHVCVIKLREDTQNWQSHTTSSFSGENLRAVCECDPKHFRGVLGYLVLTDKGVYHYLPNTDFKRDFWPGDFACLKLIGERIYLGTAAGVSIRNLEFEELGFVAFDEPVKDIESDEAGAHVFVLTQKHMYMFNRSWGQES